MSEATATATAPAVRDDVELIDPVIPTPRASLSELTTPTGDESAVEGPHDLGMSYPGVRYAMACLGLSGQ